MTQISTNNLKYTINFLNQILTQEDWNEVLYNGMEKTSAWAALYFIALMTFGNYVLLNLLVAILVDGFSSEDEPKKSVEERIIENAMQAIQKENLERERQLAKFGPKWSITVELADKGLKTPTPQFDIPEIEVSISSADEVRVNKSALNTSRSHLSGSQKSVKFNPIENTFKSNENETVKAFRPMQLPIIIHTNPTPVQTPEDPAVNFNFLGDSACDVKIDDVTIKKSKVNLDIK